MPITQERQTIEELRAAGFTEKQALLLAAKFEGTATATSEDLKGFIERRFAEMEARFDARFERLQSQMETRFAEQEARFERSLRLHLATLLSAFVAVAGLTVAILKLFPGPG